MSEVNEDGDENGLGAMAEAVAPELFYVKFMLCGLRYNRKKLREFIEKEHMLWYDRRGGVCIKEAARWNLENYWMQ